MLPLPVQQVGSGLGTSFASYHEVRGKHGGQTPFAPASPGAGVHTASLKTRSPSSGRTAASLDSEAGRPSSIFKEQQRSQRTRQGVA